MQSSRRSQQWRYLQQRHLSQQLKKVSQSFTGVTVRFNVWRFLLVAGIIVVLVGAVVWLFPESQWTAVVTLRVAVTVRDRETKDPVPGARVTCKYPAGDPHGTGELDPARFDEVLATVETNPRGQAEFARNVGCRGTTTVRGRRGRVVFDENLRVEASGYRPSETPLAMLVAGERSHNDRAPVEVTVMLYRQ